MTPRKPAPPVIRIRRVRRLVSAGAGAEPAFDAPPGARDRPRAPRDELVAGVVDVIEVPYLKPIARRRRRDRIDCRIVWPSKLDAAIAAASPGSVGSADEWASVSRIAPPPAPSATSGGHGAATHPPTSPLLSTLVGGAAAACGYVLGRVAAGGPAVFGAALSVGLALLVTVVAATIAARVGNGDRAGARGVAVIAATLALTAVVIVGAGNLRPA